MAQELLNTKFALEPSGQAIQIDLHYFRLVLSGASPSEPSPHLISTEFGRVDFLLVSFVGPSQNSMAAVLKLETERMIAMMELGFMTQLPWPHEISVLISVAGSMLCRAGCIQDRTVIETALTTAMSRADMEEVTMANCIKRFGQRTPKILVLAMRHFNNKYAIEPML